ncbi:MAG: hypothetical protein JO240_15360 [Solirubrobacterales bacterium]|nr:hypothetical protein [Solirubrobacterales bacterium]
MRRLLLTLALVGSLAGGSAALASAATSTTATSRGLTTHTATTSPRSGAAPRATPAPGRGGSSHKCPHM